MLHVRSLSKVYTPSGAAEFWALRNLSFDIRPGTLAAIVGKSGSGKSTLLNLIAGLDHATAGEVMVLGTNVGALPEPERARWRGRSVGIVFQFFQLLPTLTALENVILAMDFVGTHPLHERVDRARELLTLLDVHDQADKLPSALSGGQQQRVAIARSLANDPPVLVADEPTGNLDSANAAAVHRAFRSLTRQGRTVIVVTHDDGIAAMADQVIRLSDGQLVPDTDKTVIAS
jgi:putative ABC transport system ATP-binding protein